MLLAAEPPEVADRGLEELDPDFLRRISSLNRDSMETARSPTL